MSSNLKFIPPVGVLFYADSIAIFGADLIDGNTVVREKIRDKSYNEVIFKCLAVDDRVVIGEKIYGLSYGSNQRLLVRVDYAFSPVGPDVAKILNLAQEDLPDASS